MEGKDIRVIIADITRRILLENTAACIKYMFRPEWLRPRHIPVPFVLRRKDAPPGEIVKRMNI